MWRARDPYRARHARRAQEYGVQGTFDKYDVEIRLTKQQGLCHYCGEKLERFGPRKFTVDHFIPLSRGGSNFMNNLVIACPDCNRDKGSKMPWEFRPARFEVGCRRD
jgi:5-methylcytosine-specific restriction endonuclease McrA